MAIPGIDRVAQGVEVATESVQGAQHRLAIGKEDVMPHHRITAGDTREIAETTRGVAENIEIFVTFSQRVHQTKSQQMRQMTGRSQHLVVTLDLHVLDISTQLAP